MKYLEYLYLPSFPKNFGLLLLLLGLNACSSLFRSKPDPIESSQMTPPLTIEGHWQNTQNYFNEAIQAYKKNESDQSLFLLSKLLVQNTPPELMPFVYYNMGVVLEKEHKYSLAISKYQLAIETAGNNDFIRENTHRILRCNEKLGHWLDGLGNLKKLAKLETDPIQIHINIVRKTYLLVMLEQLEDAHKSYQQIDKSFWEQEKDDPLSKFYQAQYRALDVLFELKNYLAISLSLPEALLKAKFEKKVEKVINLETLILKVFVTRQPYWSLKVLTLLGMVYQDLFFQLSHLPPDANLDLEEQQVFWFELQKQLLPLLTKSSNVFEKQIEILKKMGQSSPVIDKIQIRLNEIHAMIEKLENRRLVIYTRSNLDSHKLMNLEAIDDY